MTSSVPSSNDDQPTPEQRGPRLTVRQLELAEALTEVDAELGGLYREGIALADRVHQPGVGHLLAHVGRELTRGVVKARLDEARQASQQELEGVEESESHRVLIGGCLGLRPEDPQVSQWFELHRYFPAAAHFRGSGATPDPEALRLHFARLERLLYGLIGPYFNTQAEIDELLRLESPTADDVDRVLALLPRHPSRRYFYGMVANPAWLRLLREKGVFEHPPDRHVNADGSWHAVDWPQGALLLRMAPHEPELVVEVLCKLPPTNSNPSVWHIVANVANVVPTEAGRRLVPLLAKAMGTLVPVLFMQDVLKLIARLADAGHQEAFELAGAALSVPDARDVSKGAQLSYRSDWLLPRLQWTQFSKFREQALPALERCDRERTLALLLDRVNQIAAVSRKCDFRILDHWHRRRDGPSADDAGAQLIEATAGVVERSASSGVDQARRVVQMLGQYEGDVVIALKYRLIAVAGVNLRELLDAVLSSSVAVEPGPFRREVALILREQYANASDYARAMFRYSIGRGPAPEAMTGGLSSRDVDRPTPAAIEETKRGWQARRLLWFRGAIPNELRGLAESLAVWGKTPSIREQELGEVGFYAGEVSLVDRRPFTAEALNGRSAAEIAQLLTEWRPDATSVDAEVTRGLELNIQELSERNPQQALDVWEAAGEGLSAQFAISLLDGIGRAVKGRTTSVDWKRVLVVVAAAVSRAARLEGPTSTRRALVGSAMSVVEGGISSGQIPPALQPDVWSAIGEAVRQEYVWDEDDEEFHSFGALLSAALNRAAAKIVQVAVDAGMWSHRLGEAVRSEEALRDAERLLTSVLDEVLKHAGGGRATAEVVLGTCLPQLELITPAWLESNIGNLLEAGAREPIRHPTWGAYVTSGRFYDSTFAHLRAWYSRAAEAAGAEPHREAEAGDSWSLSRALAEHVLIAVQRGVAAIGDPDELVEKTFASVPVADRKHAYWSVFRAWSDMKERPPDATIARLLSFWEWRLDQLEKRQGQDDVVDEAEGLGWLLRTPHLPAADVLRLGVRTATTAKGRLEAHLDWERLHELAEADADRAFDIAELALVAQLVEPPHFVAVDEVLPVLRLVLDRGRPETRDRVRRLVHRLGEAGYDGFRELLT